MIVSWQESYDKLSVLKSRDITLLTKVHIVKAVVFLGTVVRTGHKEGRAPKN